MDALNPAGPPDYKTGAIADNRSRVIGVGLDSECMVPCYNLINTLNS